MPTQDELFHEDWRDALRHVVKALGGCEAVGVDLWPTKTRKAAGNWLSDCLNGDRPAKLHLEEIEAILKMGRERGVHTGMYILADRVGYERPQQAVPKSQQAILIEKYEATLAELRRVQEELDRINNGVGLKLAR
jgi:transposase